MNIMKNRIIAFLLCMIVTFALYITVGAAELPDFDRLCSITVNVSYDGEAVSGGSISIYHVGEPTVIDGKYCFIPTEDFMDCGETFDKTYYGPYIAKRLAKYVINNNIEPLSTKEIGEDGTVTFDGLSVGLYLIVQNEAADGYSALDPFLVSVPSLENGKYDYDLKTAPKTELEPDPDTTETEPTTEPETEPIPDTEPTTDTETTDDTEPVTDTETDTETEPETEPDSTTKEDDPKLPQTGMLWWPVPVFASLGVLLVTVGVVLMRKQKTDEE